MSIFMAHLHLNEIFAHMRYVVKLLIYLAGFEQDDR